MYLWRWVKGIHFNWLRLLNYPLKKYKYFMWYVDSRTALTFRNSIPKCNTKNYYQLTVSSISKNFYFNVRVCLCVAVYYIKVSLIRIPEMAFFVPRENTFDMFVNSVVERKMQLPFRLILLSDVLSLMSVK